MRIDPESSWYHGYTNMMNMVLVNVLTLLMCIPILTAGAAITAANRLCMDILRDEDTYIVRRWWKTVRDEFAGSLWWWIPALILLGTGWAESWWLGNASSGMTITWADGLRALLLSISVCIVGVLVWIFPLVAYFSNTARAHVRNASILALQHLGRTSLIVLLLAAPELGAVLFPSARLVLGWYIVLLGITFPAYCAALLQRRVIDTLRDEADTPTNADPAAGPS